MASSARVLQQSGNRFDDRLAAAFSVPGTNVDIAHTFEEEILPDGGSNASPAPGQKVVFSAKASDHMTSLADSYVTATVIADVTGLGPTDATLSFRGRRKVPFPLTDTLGMKARGGTGRYSFLTVAGGGGATWCGMDYAPWYYAIAKPETSGALQGNHGLPNHEKGAQFPQTPGYIPNFCFPHLLWSTAELEIGGRTVNSVDNGLYGVKAFLQTVLGRIGDNGGQGRSSFTQPKMLDTRLTPESSVSFAYTGMQSLTEGTEVNPEDGAAPVQTLNRPIVGSGPGITVSHRPYLQNAAPADTYWQRRTPSNFVMGTLSLPSLNSGANERRNAAGFYNVYARSSAYIPYASANSVVMGLLWRPSIPMAMVRRLVPTSVELRLTLTRNLNDARCHTAWPFTSVIASPDGELPVSVTGFLPVNNVNPGESGTSFSFVTGVDYTITNIRWWLTRVRLREEAFAALSSAMVERPLIYPFMRTVTQRYYIPPGVTNFDVTEALVGHRPSLVTLQVLDADVLDGPSNPGYEAPYKISTMSLPFTNDIVRGGPLVTASNNPDMPWVQISYQLTQAYINMNGNQYPQKAFNLTGGPVQDGAPINQGALRMYKWYSDASAAGFDTGVSPFMSFEQFCSNPVLCFLTSPDRNLDEWSETSQSSTAVHLELSYRNAFPVRDSTIGAESQIPTASDLNAGLAVIVTGFIPSWVAISGTREVFKSF